jgi:hypothetical protein
MNEETKKTMEKWELVAMFRMPILLSELPKLIETLEKNYGKNLRIATDTHDADWLHIVREIVRPEKKEEPATKEHERHEKE